MQGVGLGAQLYNSGASSLESPLGEAPLASAPSLYVFQRLAQT